MRLAIRHNPFTQEDRDMITDFDDFCLWVYVIVDDIWQQMASVQASWSGTNLQR